MVWCGVAWRGVAWRGVAWRGVAWRGVAWHGMCSLAVITLDSPAVEPRSNPDSGKILMSENLRLYTPPLVVMC